MGLLRYGITLLLLIAFWQTVYFLVVLQKEYAPVVDTDASQVSLFETAERMAVYSTPLLARNAARPEVVILGSSDIQLGLRPAELSPLLGGVRVHNIGIGSGNILTDAELVDLIYRQTSAAERPNIVFVLGLVYPAMADDKRQWPTGFTLIDDELVRYGLMGRTHRISVSDAILSSCLMASWTLMEPYASYVHGLRAMHEDVSFASIALPANVPPIIYPPLRLRNTELFPQEKRQEFMEGFAKRMGPVEQLTDHGFEQLVSLAKHITAEGGKLVVLDLPLPRWHSDNSPYYADYEKRKLPYIDALRHINGVNYSDMREGLEENAFFFDGIHPVPRITPEWAKRATQAIHPLLTR